MGIVILQINWRPYLNLFYQPPVGPWKDGGPFLEVRISGSPRATIDQICLKPVVTFKLDCNNNN